MATNTCEAGRQCSHNMISGKPGATGLSKNVEIELDQLKPFLAKSMLNSVIEYSNRIINHLNRCLLDNFNGNHLSICNHLSISI